MEVDDGVGSCSRLRVHTDSSSYHQACNCYQYYLLFPQCKSLPSSLLAVQSRSNYHAHHVHQDRPYLLGDVNTRKNAKLYASSTSTTKDEPTAQQKKDNIRPLTQNWWPVSLVSALDQTKPNAIELLDKKLVLWYDTSSTEGDGQWSCLDDQCAHRFAPLSEGRIVTNATTSRKSCLQCVYHGWEFERRGGCNRIPQAANDNAKSSKLCTVQSYPIQISAGMIWVWADPIVKPSEEDPPISNLLQRFDEAGGTARGFQRDLPYGYELLGENLADISH